MDAALILFAAAVLGAVMIAGGVFVLAGLGWCLIASGAMTICAAAFIRRGLTDG